MSQFIGFRKHYQNPHTKAHERANNAGGLKRDVDGSVLAAAHAALFSGGVVKLAEITTTATAAGTIGGEPGSGSATVYTISFPDDVTPVLDAQSGQEILNPFTDEHAAGTVTVVVDTGRVKVIILPPITASLIQSLIPTPPPIVGSRSGATVAVLTLLLAALDGLGVIDDRTTA